MRLVSRVGSGDGIKLGLAVGLRSGHNVYARMCVSVFVCVSACFCVRMCARVYVNVRVYIPQRLLKYACGFIVRRVSR